MNKQLIYLMICVVIIGCTTACGSQRLMVSPEGDHASVFINKNRSIEAELLSVTDSVLYVYVLEGRENLNLRHDEILVGILLHEIESIRLKGYSNDSWVLPWFILQFMPPILYTIAASSVEGGGAGGVFIISSIPGLVSLMTLGFGGTKNPRFNNVKNQFEIYSIRNHCRYPLGLNAEQLQFLADQAGQNGYRIINVNSR